nr:MAG TPA: hypothetical protein [Caudoviricetes sp.]
MHRSWDPITRLRRPKGWISQLNSNQQRANRSLIFKESFK